MPAEKKITVTIFVGGRKNCDDKVENCDFLCFKISSANGVFDIFVDIFKSSRICYFLRNRSFFTYFKDYRNIETGYALDFIFEANIFGGKVFHRFNSHSLDAKI